MIPEALKTVCHCGKQFCGVRGTIIACDCGRRLTIGEPAPQGYGAERDPGLNFFYSRWHQSKCTARWKRIADAP